MISADLRPSQGPRIIAWHDPYAHGMILPQTSVARLYFHCCTPSQGCISAYMMFALKQVPSHEFCTLITDRCKVQIPPQPLVRPRTPCTYIAHGRNKASKVHPILNDARKEAKTVKQKETCVYCRLYTVLPRSRSVVVRVGQRQVGSPRDTDARDKRLQRC